jgi:hypothetical protein
MSEVLSRRDWWIFWLLMAAGGLFRVYLFGSGRLEFESDQAIAGIVALEALHHGNWLLMTPGANYGGQLLSFYLVPFHAVFGASVAAMRLAMIPLSLLVAACASGCAWVLFRSRPWAFTVLALVLFSPSMVCEFFMRPAMLYLIPTCAVLIGVASLVTIMRRSPHRVWTRREVVIGFGTGMVLGVGYWTHPIVIQHALALLVFLPCFPRQAMFVLGLPSLAPGGPDRTRDRVVATTLQVVLLVLVTLLTYVLLLRRPILPALLPSNRYNQLAFLSAAAGMVLAAQLWFTARNDREAVLSRFGAVVWVVGVWVGAFPVIWYLWFEHQRLIFVQSHVSWDVFVSQLASIFHTGIPILLGFFQSWRVELAGMPAWLRWAAHGIYWAGLLFAAAVAIRGRAAGGRRTEGLWFFFALFGVVAVTFSASPHGWFIAEPRYALILFFVFVMSAGCFVGGLCRKGGLLAMAAPVLLGLLLTANVWTCLGLPRLPLEPWTGVAVSDRQLISELKLRKITRVSCRYSKESYWLAYKLTYEAGEEVLFAPADFPADLGIRSQRHQRAVNEAPVRAYMVTLREAPALEDRLGRDRAAFKKLCVADYVVFYDLQPDVLNKVPWDKYLEERKAASGRGK